MRNKHNNDITRGSLCLNGNLTVHFRQSRYLQCPLHRQIQPPYNVAKSTPLNLESYTHLLQIGLTLQRQGVAFRSLTEQMDTTMPHGAFLFSLFGALTQYERALTQERITAGLAAARRRGKHGGRPRAISAEQLEAILAALQGGASKVAICRTFGVKRSTLLDALARMDVLSGPSVEGRVPSL